MKSYNRYTPKHQQSQLSVEAKTEAVLLYAPLAEKLSRLKDHVDIWVQLIPQLNNNLMISSSKRNFILHLIDLYANSTR